MRSGCWGWSDSLVSPSLYNVTNPGGSCAAVAWPDVCVAALSVHASDSAGMVPLRLAATAQSIYGTLCIGLTTALLTLASGVLYERMGGSAFLVMAALCLLALPMCAALRSAPAQACT